MHEQAYSDYWNSKASLDLARAHQHWQSQPVWGMWNLPEDELRLLADVKGKDVIDLGCGSAYLSAWLCRMGARPVAVDYSERQLRLVAQLQDHYGLCFPRVHADASRLPFAAQSFDLAVSEYGACTWCDPVRWLPEAARVLRPHGRLIFLVNSNLLMLCSSPQDGHLSGVLQRDHYDYVRLDEPGFFPPEHHLSPGEWIRHLRLNGFVVDDLLELRPRQGSQIMRPDVPHGWACRWPSEHVWIAHKASD